MTGASDDIRCILDVLDTGGVKLHVIIACPVTFTAWADRFIEAGQTAGAPVELLAKLAELKQDGLNDIAWSAPELYDATSFDHKHRMCRYVVACDSGADAEWTCRMRAVYNMLPVGLHWIDADKA